jgi:Zn-dependent M28 family amino/carboxypeptidase
MRTSAFLLLCALLFTSCAKDPVDHVLATVSPESLMEHVRVLAHDSLLGRAPGTLGEQKTTAYLADRLKAYGLEPMGENGTYFQRVTMLAHRILPTTTSEVRGGGKTLRLTNLQDVALSSGTPMPELRLTDVPMIFVGYGVVAPEQQWDDYKGTDVRGAVLVFLNNDPPSDDPKVFGGKARTLYGRWTYKYDIAARKGAAGAIVIHTDTSAGYPWSVVSKSGESLLLASDAATSTLKMKAWMAEGTTREVLRMSGLDLDALVAAAAKPDFRPVRLKTTYSSVMRMTVRTFDGVNVLGLVRGRDPELSKDVIVFSSHHDHFGIGTPVRGDSIYNGALDNASGCAMSLELARAFASMQPRTERSLLFTFVTAEEFGLLGSAYLAQHLPVPLAHAAANINIDGFNVYGKTADVTFLGYDRSTLGNDLSSAAKAMGLTITPDQHPEQGHFYRSDHFNFAKVGIPPLSMGEGKDYIGKSKEFSEQVGKNYNDNRYHQPSDQLSDDWPWTLDGAMQQVELISRITVRLAGPVPLPQWNKGDEFEAVRLETLMKR